MGTVATPKSDLSQLDTLLATLYTGFAVGLLRDEKFQLLSQENLVARQVFPVIGQRERYASARSG